MRELMLALAISVACHASMAAQNHISNAPLPKAMWEPYFPDVSKPLYADYGVLACDTATDRQHALRAFESSLKVDWKAPGCQQMKADQQVSIRGYTLGSMRQAVLAEIEGPTHRLQWTLLQWLDDHADMTTTVPAFLGWKRRLLG